MIILFELSILTTVVIWFITQPSQKSLHCCLLLSLHFSSYFFVKFLILVQHFLPKKNQNIFLSALKLHQIKKIIYMLRLYFQITCKTNLDIIWAATDLHHIYCIIFIHKANTFFIILYLRTWFRILIFTALCTVFQRCFLRHISLALLMSVKECFYISAVIVTK